MKTLGTLLTALSFLTGCTGGTTQPVKPENNNSTEIINYEQKLRTASTITISEYVISLGKDYDILADGVKVGTVEGKNLKLWGDVFTLKILDGKVLASEKENKRILFQYNREASVHDVNDTIIGYFAEEKFNDWLSWGYIFHFYDADRNEVGKSQKIGKGAWNYHKLFDNQGNTDYTVDKKFVMMGGDKYEIQVHDFESAIPLEQAILLICVEDAIADAND